MVVVPKKQKKVTEKRPNRKKLISVSQIDEIDNSYTKALSDVATSETDINAEQASFNHSRYTFFNYFRISILCTFLALLVVGSFFSYKMYGENRDKMSNIDEILATVRTMVAVDEEHEPIVANVQDPESIEDKLFKAEAKKGDFIIIFKRKVVLFDPQVNKVKIAIPLE